MAAGRKLQGGSADPMIAALLDKLPAPGSSWPAEKRAVWMQMLWGAFGLVYEADGAAAELPAFLQGSRLQPMIESGRPPTPFLAPYAFYIDLDGTARRDNGAPITPEQVGGEVIYDKRGEGDFATIVWADGSRGIRPGLQLNISPAF